MNVPLAARSRCVAILATAAVLLPVASAQDDGATSRSAEELLAELTLPQKAGQLFMSWSLTRPTADGANHEQLLQWIHEAELGGIILSLGDVEQAAKLVPELQQASRVPLLMAGDFEGGVWFRLDGATELGNNMLMGAGRSEWLTEQAGRVTGEEAAALGFHWVFAPVLDVNSNPDNPIINVRSFGEDPELVARLGAAFVRGVQGAGQIACGKHFPGHGDVSSDSHLELPTVPGDGDRLRRVELRPFGVAAKAGLGSVMTGHLAVPGLGEDPKLPATLSKLILGDVLRDELGFTGLVVTDALEMGGVKNAFAPGEVAVRALLAGADVLLMPPDPIAARAAVVEAVASGRVPLARLDDAVLRILRAKERVGLLSAGDRGRVATDWRARVNTPAGQQLARDLAARGVTLVRDRGGEWPWLSWDEGQASKAALVMVFDRDDGAEHEFEVAMKGSVASVHRVAAKSANEAIEAARAAVAGAERVILSLHVKVRAYSGGVALPPNVQPVLAALRDDQQIVGVSFGNPYLISDLPAIDTYLCTYVDTAYSQRAAVDVLRGLQPVSGRLPVSIPGVAEAGTGLVRYRLLGDERAPAATHAGYDVDPGLGAALRERLTAAVANGAFPGAVCLVARHGEVVAEVAVGSTSYGADARPVRPDTLYDLASLTKVCATTPAVLRLVAASRLQLEDPVSKWVPAFRGDGKDDVQVRHLLAHCSGLPPFLQYYKDFEGKAEIVEAAAATPLRHAPGTKTVYSDIGFILLMAIVEAASGQSFEDNVREASFWRPGHRARFVPTGGWSAGAAPTEECAWRGRLVEGYVHDENAFAMGGISGHAGLFATARDVLTVGLDYLGGGRESLPPAVAALATRPAGIVPGDDSRAIGLGMLRAGSWAGTEVSPGAFGHTGFTGTSLVCDPELDYCVVLLTNRVHPTRENRKITAVRRAVHDLVRGAMR